MNPNPKPYTLNPKPEALPGSKGSEVTFGFLCLGFGSRVEGLEVRQVFQRCTVWGSGFYYADLYKVRLFEG